MVFHRILDFKKGPISIGLCVFPEYKDDVRRPFKRKLLRTRLFSQ